MLQATSRMLDKRTDAERAAQLQFADAAQWEYEDEYDDSYDDLAPFGNDGIADVEGRAPAICQLPLLKTACVRIASNPLACADWPEHINSACL